MNKVVIDKKDLEALKALDPVLSKFIDSVKAPIIIYANNDFVGVSRTLIAQLISNKSATTIHDRLIALLGVVDEDTFLNAKEEDIIACGVYKKKYDQIYNIANDMKSGILDFHELAKKSDAEIIKVLTAYPGVGLWTAEMIMLYGMKHPNILSYGDFGIKSGIKKVYGLEELSKEQFLEIKERLSPYGTIASFYFWLAHGKE